jgi:hypothetical protein
VQRKGEMAAGWEVSKSIAIRMAPKKHKHVIIFFLFMGMTDLLL